MAPPAPRKNVPAPKQLVRNIEVPIRKDAVRFVNSQPERAADPGDKYRTPGFKTTLELEEQMRRVRAAPIPPSRNVNDLTPKAQEFVQEKAAQKLNFPATQSVFKELQPINVNDSVLELRCPISRPRCKSITRQDKDPEPVLRDYLTSIALMSTKCVLDDFGCEQVQFVRAPDLDNYHSVCQLLDALDCDT